MKEQGSHISEIKAFQAEGVASAKVLRQDPTGMPEAHKLVWLVHRGKRQRRRWKPR